jgi:hypothetical protein
MAMARGGMLVELMLTSCQEHVKRHERSRMSLKALVHPYGF